MPKSILLTATSGITTLLFLGLAAPALALTTPSQGGLGGAPLGAPAPPVTTVTGLYNPYVCGILNWVYVMAIILAVLFLLITAYRYMASHGDPEKLKLGHKTLIYVLVGVAVAVLAKSLPPLLAKTLGADSAAATVCP